jgi:cytochrome P450
VAQTPPGPPPRKNGVGSLFFYARFALDPIGFVGERFRRYGDLYCATSDGVPLFVLKHPDHIAQVLLGTGKFGKGHSALDRLSHVLGNGLLTSEGDEWKRQRRMIQPAFTKKKLQGYAGVMTDECERAASRWAQGGVRDMSREMVELTLRVVTRTLFDHDAGDETDDVAGAMRDFNAYMGRPDLVPAWLPSPARTRLKRSIERLDALIDGLVRARKPGEARSDLLQSLVDAVDVEGDGARLTPKELRDQLVTLYLAGHETTSHALTWTWSLLSRNPEKRQALHEELARVLGGRTPTWDDLPALPYTEQVVLEAMRLYPPAFVLARKAETDAEIGGYDVAAGTEVVIWIFHTHRDARWYPSPLAFRPERHTPESVAARPKLAYLPFGAGPRACIGAQFSLLEARLVLATLAQRFALDTVPGHKIAMKPGVTLMPKGGMPMRISARA